VCVRESREIRNARYDYGHRMSPEHLRPVRRDLTSATLARLLERLGDSPDRAGDQYNAIRSRLVRLFRWQALPDAEALADDVLGRVARRLHEGEQIPNVFGYASGVARLVALEARQRGERERRTLEEYARRVEDSRAPAADPHALDCLERCLAGLSAERRDLLLAYYTGDRDARIRQRSRLAERLGIGPVALRNRMLRLRHRLEGCLADCLERPPNRDGSTHGDIVSRRGRTPPTGDEPHD
jgi:DNA-directed RNA polymerase specialized sigma24 family protein